MVVAQEIEGAREGVAVLMNDMGYTAVIVFECASPRNLWIKFKFSRVKVCAVVANSPIEGNVEERERFLK